MSLLKESAREIQRKRGPVVANPGARSAGPRSASVIAPMGRDGNAAVPRVWETKRGGGQAASQNGRAEAPCRVTSFVSCDLFFCLYVSRRPVRPVRLVSHLRASHD